MCFPPEAYLLSVKSSPIALRKMTFGHVLIERFQHVCENILQ